MREASYIMYAYHQFTYRMDGIVMESTTSATDMMSEDCNLNPLTKISAVVASALQPYVSGRSSESSNTRVSGHESQYQYIQDKSRRSILPVINRDLEG